MDTEVNNETSVNNVVPTIEKRIEHKEQSEESYKNDFSEGLLEKIEVDGRKQFYKLQMIWSLVIIGWISIIIFFHIILTCFIGNHRWNFSHAPYFLPSILIENFLQITAMGFVIVKFFHPKSMQNFPLKNLNKK